MCIKAASGSVLQYCFFPENLPYASHKWSAAQGICEKAQNTVDFCFSVFHAHEQKTCALSGSVLLKTERYPANPVSLILEKPKSFAGIPCLEASRTPESYGAFFLPISQWISSRQMYICLHRLLSFTDICQKSGATTSNRTMIRGFLPGQQPHKVDVSFAGAFYLS